MFELKKQKLLVIAPHPDDEVLGCAGLIKKIKDNKGKVFILFLTLADTKDFLKTTFSTSLQREKEIKNVAKLLKFDDYDIALRGSDYHLKLDRHGQFELMNLIERKSKVAIEKIRPTIIAFPDPDSYNQDHRLAARSTHAALRPAAKENKHFVDTVLSYEMPADNWSLSPVREPDIFLPLSGSEMENKIKAWKLYKSQLRDAPNPRSLKIVKDFASFRGSLAGCEYAECFRSHRILFK